MEGQTNRAIEFPHGRIPTWPNSPMAESQNCRDIPAERFYEWGKWWGEWKMIGIEKGRSPDAGRMVDRDRAMVGMVWGDI
jgi:hypothetical protein